MVKVNQKEFSKLLNQFYVFSTTRCEFISGYGIIIDEESVASVAKQLHYARSIHYHGIVAPKRQICVNDITFKFSDQQLYSIQIGEKYIDLGNVEDDEMELVTYQLAFFNEIRELEKEKENKIHRKNVQESLKRVSKDFKDLSTEDSKIEEVKALLQSPTEEDIKRALKEQRKAKRTLSIKNSQKFMKEEAQKFMKKEAERIDPKKRKPKERLAYEEKEKKEREARILLHSEITEHLEAGDEWWLKHTNLDKDAKDHLAFERHRLERIRLDGIKLDESKKEKETQLAVQKFADDSLECVKEKEKSFMEKVLHCGISADTAPLSVPGLIVLCVLALPLIYVFNPLSILLYLGFGPLSAHTVDTIIIVNNEENKKRSEPKTLEPSPKTYDELMAEEDEELTRKIEALPEATK